MHAWLNVIGTMLNLVGGWTLASILIMSKKQAINAGVTRWASKEEDVNLRLPMVQLFIEQSRRTVLGMTIITVGYLMQIVGNWPTK